MYLKSRSSSPQSQNFAALTPWISARWLQHRQVEAAAVPRHELRRVAVDAVEEAADELGFGVAGFAQRPDAESVALAQRAGDRDDALQMQRQKIAAGRRAPLLQSPTSRTSASGKLSPAIDARRRMPATSGIVSMSKTRVGVMGPRGRAAPCRSTGKDAGRQVAVAAVADDEHDRRVGDLVARCAARPRRRRPTRCRRRCPPRAPARRAMSSASACDDVLDAIDALAHRRSSAGTPPATCGCPESASLRRAGSRRCWIAGFFSFR